MAAGNPALFKPGLSTHVTARDCDDMASFAVGWSNEYRQMGSGRFVGDVRQLHTRQAQVSVVDFSPGVRVLGEQPPGTHMFAMPLAGNALVTWQGRPLDAQDVIFCRRGSEVDYHSIGAIRLIVLAIGEDQLEASSLRLYDESFRSLRIGDRLRLRPPGPGGGLAGDMARLARTMQHATDEVTRERLERVLADRLLAGLAPREPVGSMHWRQHGARKVERFIREHAELDLALDDLCAAAAVPKRTLQLGFRECYGMSPTEYLRIWRLNQVHQELRHGRASVTEVATRWGFLHLGRFSAAYRAVFGAAPSETRRQGRTVGSVRAQADSGRARQEHAAPA